MSTRLFLVRHGESVWNAEGRVQGQADPPLSQRGTVQAYALAEALSARPLAAVYCSPLQRAHTTACYIAALHDLHAGVVEALREVDLGAWQGRTFSELDSIGGESARGWRAESSADASHGGETLAEAHDRVAPALDALLDAHGGDTIVLVTHSIIGRVILCHLLGTGLDLVRRLKLKQASISMVRLDGDGAVLERLGDTSHLGGMDGRPDSATYRAMLSGMQP